MAFTEGWSRGSALPCQCPPVYAGLSLLSCLCWLCILVTPLCSGRELPAVPGALRSMNKTHPQRNGDIATSGSTESFSGQRGCCHPCGAHTGCTQRPLCISVMALLVLVVALASWLALVLLPQAPVNRLCTAPNNKTGFLCDDRVTCVPASWVCDNISNCRNGEDEQEQLCGDLPHSLPGHLVFYCRSPRSWVYADQRCNGMNDCGDCSDETGNLAACPPCGPDWWSCSPVHYEFCSCIPRRLCRDGIQHCLGWSDEFLCTV